MDLIVNQVVQHQEVHNTNGDGVIELETCAAVGQNGLTVFTVAGFFERFADIRFMRAVENRCCNLLAELSVSKAQVHFKNLSDIHTGRNAQGIEHDIQRCTVIQERHIFLRQNAGNNALVTVTARHFIADGNLTFLRDIATDNLVDTGA